MADYRSRSEFKLTHYPAPMSAVAANPRASVPQKGYDRHVIDLKQVAIGVVMGSVLLVFGLVPGLFQGLAEGVRNALASFQNGNPLSPRFQVHPGGQAQFGQPRWLAATGAALIAVTLLAYFSN